MLEIWTAVETSGFVLTAVEFDVLWEGLRLGPTPVALRLPSAGRTHDERRAVQAAGWQSLQERGLAAGSQPVPELSRLARLLARPDEQLELRGWWEHPVRAVAARRAGAGVLTVLQNGAVTLGPCDDLPSGLLRAVPPASTGAGRASAVPTDVLAAALAETDTEAALLSRRVPLREARMLDRVLHATERRAQIVALGSCRGGIRRAGGVLGILDGPHGRYLMTHTSGADAVDWTTVGPTDPRRLRQRVAELLAEATVSREAGSVSV